MNKKNAFENTYICVQGWMVTVLNLKGNELLCFGLIYGFNQDGESEFKGSIRYITKWLNCSRPTAIKSAESLVDKKFILKRQEVISGVTFNRYSVNWVVVSTLRKNFTGSKETLLGGSKETLLGGSKETLHSNILSNIINNITNSKVKERVNILIVEGFDKLPEQEQKIQTAFYKCLKWFDEYPAMIQQMKVNAKITSDYSEFDIFHELDQWIRRHSANYSFMTNVENEISSSFQNYLQKYKQFNPLKTGKYAKGNSKTGSTSSQAERIIKKLSEEN